MKLRPSDIYGAETREIIKTQLHNRGLKIVAFRRPYAEESYVAYAGGKDPKYYQRHLEIIKVGDPNHLFLNSSVPDARLIVEPITTTI